MPREVEIQVLRERAHRNPIGLEWERHISRLKIPIVPVATRNLHIYILATIELPAMNK